MCPRLGPRATRDRDNFFAATPGSQPRLGHTSPPVLIDRHGVKHVASCRQLEEGDELYKSAWCLKWSHHTLHSLTRTCAMGLTLSLSSCLQLTLDALQFGLLQHTAAGPACPKFLTFRLWVPLGSLLPLEHQAWPSGRLPESSAPFPLPSEHCASPDTGAEGGDKPGVPWEGLQPGSLI